MRIDIEAIEISGLLRGGATITQQLVRGYFLHKLTSTKNSNPLQHEGIFPHLQAFVIDVPGTNKLLLKIETIRLSMWIEGEMRKQYGSSIDNDTKNMSEGWNLWDKIWADNPLHFFPNQMASKGNSANIPAL